MYIENRHNRTRCVSDNDAQMQGDRGIERERKQEKDEKEMRRYKLRMDNEDAHAEHI